MHVGAQQVARRDIDLVGAGDEHHAVIFLGRLLRHVAAAHVALDRDELAVEWRAEAAASAGAQDVGVARFQHLVEGLAVGKALLGLGEAMDGDAIAGAGEAAEQAPGLAHHPVHLGIEADVVARLHDLLDAEAAARKPAPPESGRSA